MQSVYDFCSAPFLSYKSALEKGLINKLTNFLDHDLVNPEGRAGWFYEHHNKTLATNLVQKFIMPTLMKACGVAAAVAIAYLQRYLYKLYTHYNDNGGHGATPKTPPPPPSPPPSNDRPGFFRNYHYIAKCVDVGLVNEFANEIAPIINHNLEQARLEHNSFENAREEAAKEKEAVGDKGYSYSHEREYSVAENRLPI